MEAAQKRWLWRAAAGLILGVHFTLLVLVARQKSVTADEPFHIARGVSALFSGDFRMSVSHPPLVNLISALPLLAFRNLQVPLQDPTWLNPGADDADRKSRFARIFLWTHDSKRWAGNPDPLAIIFWCRVPIMLLSVTLGLLLYRRAARHWGPPSGLMALLLYCLSPTVLAHAGLATTDIGSALFIFIFALALMRHLERPGPWTLAGLGIAFGLAQLAKFTSILLIPLLPISFLLAPPLPWRDRFRAFFLPRGRVEALTGLYAGLFVLVMGAAIVWAGYGFEIRSIHRIAPPAPVPIGQPGNFVKHLMVRAMAAIPLPPRTYYYGLSRTLLDTEEHPHPLYFLGQISHRGWWYYYPVLFPMKEPIALLLLLAAGLLLIRRPPPRDRPERAVVPVLAVGIVLFFMFLNSKNIGIRHLLPVYPLLFLWLSRLAAVRVGRVWPAGCWALLSWYALNGVVSYPDYLIHFNSLVGGPEGGLKLSVVGEDWGQDIPALAKFVKERGIEKIHYNPYGKAEPLAYGIPHQHYRCMSREPGWYAVNVVDLYRPFKDEAEDCYRDFLSRKPVAVLHHTIYIYRIEGSSPAADTGPPAEEEMPPGLE